MDDAYFYHEAFDLDNYERYFEGFKTHFPDSKYQDFRELMIPLMKEAFTDGVDDAFIRREVQQSGIERELNEFNLTKYDWSFVHDWKTGDVVSDVIFSASVGYLLIAAYRNGQGYGIVSP